MRAPEALLRAFTTPSEVFTVVESLVDVLFSAVLRNFHDAYEEFVNTLESIKIMMIRVFFSGGKCKDCLYSPQFPPPNFPASDLPWQLGCSTRRLLVASRRTCVLVVHRERGASMRRSDQFSSIFESNQFSCFFVGQISWSIVECLLRVQLHGATFLPGSGVHSTNWFSSPVWGHMLA